MIDLFQQFNKKLGFGSLRLPVLEHDNGNVDYATVSLMVDEYLAQGFKYFEVAYNYHQAEATIKKCLVERYPRDSYILADKMPVVMVTETGHYKKIFADQLERCGVTWFDFYLLHNLGYDVYLKTEKLGGFEFLKGLKQRGLAKYIGFSFHDKAEVLEEILGKYHLDIDFVQLQINYLDWESPVIQSRKCYEVARKYNLPILVMEPVKGGRLFNLPDAIKREFALINPNASAASWAIRYVASLEGVALVLSGMSDVMQLRDNTNYMSDFKPLNDAERKAIARAVEFIRKEQRIQCTQCRYCLSVCPKHIPIPEVLHLYDNDNAGHVGRMYERICENKGKASDCLKCGRCERACSQHLEIRKYLKEIADVYEGSFTSSKIKLFLKKVHLLKFAKLVWREIKKIQ